MDWDALSAVGEIAGAVGVLLTLMYLARETHRTRVATETAAVHELSEGWNNLNVSVMSNPQLAEVWRQGFEDPDSLDPTQQVQFQMIGQSYSNHFITIKKQYDAGFLPESEWRVHSDSYLNMMTSPGGEWILGTCGINPDVLELVQNHSEVERAFKPVLKHEP